MGGERVIILGTGIHGLLTEPEPPELGTGSSLSPGRESFSCP